MLVEIKDATEIIQSKFRIELTHIPKVLAVDEGVYQLLGFTADDFLASKVALAELIHHHDQDIADDLFSSNLKVASDTFNIRLRHADGKIRCLKGNFDKLKEPVTGKILLQLLLQDAKSLWRKEDTQSIVPSLKAMMENTNDYIYFKDRNHIMTGASQTLVTVTDPSEHWTDLLGKSDYDIFPEELADKYYRLEKQVFAGVLVAHEVQETLDKFGNKGWVDNRKGPIKDDDNEIIGLFGIARDITTSKRNAEVLRALAEKAENTKGNIFELIAKQIVTSQNVNCALIAAFKPNSQFEVETLGVCINGAIVDNFSYKLAGTPCQNVIHENDVCFYPDHIQRLFPDDLILADINAESYLGFPLRDESGELLGLIAIVDIKQMDKNMLDLTIVNSLVVRAGMELGISLSNRKNLLASRVFNSTQEGITVTDSNNIIVDVNPAFTDITGYSRDEILGKNHSILDSDKESSEFYAEIWHSLAEEGHWQGEIWNKKKSGQLFAQLVTISTFFDDDESLINYVRVFTDITQTKQQQEKLLYMAHYDGLTGLPNRLLFTDRFHQAIAHGKRTSQQLAICFLDIDNFKPVNDNFGHDVGDKLLIEVAQRILTCLREEDSVSRLGGDEFVLLLNDIESRDKCEQTLKRIHHSLAQPFDIDGHSHRISVSIGVTIYPNDDNDIDTLLRHADQAMYQAKLSGKDGHKFFCQEQKADVINRHSQIRELEKALSNNEFELHYQIQVDDLTLPMGAEALIRRRHPSQGLILPIDFIPLAEKSDLILTIGNWVLEQACMQLKKWEESSETSSLSISINVSPKEFHQPDFAEHVLATVKKYAVKPGNLKLEITETVLLDDIDKVISVMTTLNTFGIGFELDDFGTGYSSLQYLKKLPIERLKIDQSFVRDITTDAGDQAIVLTIIAMAESLGLEVIAEGVETEEQWLLLQQQGCRNYQGYFFSKPLPIDEFRNTVSNLHLKG